LKTSKCAHCPSAPMSVIARDGARLPQLDNDNFVRSPGMWFFDTLNLT
jgi:hypothetical protein